MTSRPAVPHRADARPPGAVDLPPIEYGGDAVAAYLEDAAHLAGGRASGIAMPESAAEIAAICRLGVPLLPIGAQSSVTGGATPMGELLVSTVRLRGIGRPADGEVRVQAGVSLAQLEAALNAQGWTYPPTPTWMAATVGGIVSTNAAGPATFKYGVTREWVLGVTVVLATGDVLEVRRGETRADDHGVLEIRAAGRTLRLQVPPLTWPSVPKRSAGYACAPGMDLVDLFVGSEGTLGIIVDATLRVAPLRGSRVRAMVPCESEAQAIAFVDRLRRESQATWRSRDPNGIDVSAIEHLDGRSLDIVREDGVDRREKLALPAEARVLLFVDLEFAAVVSGAEVWSAVQDALEPGAPDSPITRFCRLTADAGVLQGTELALPGDHRMAAMTAIREAVPSGVNARVARAQAEFGSAIQKTAADMIVPWERFPEMQRTCHALFSARGLDYAIWGHISDGNLHPNVLPRRPEDVDAGKTAILELGDAVLAMGGCPLAEHGVGRHPVKKLLLQKMHGEAGVAAMRELKRALDPDEILSPGVLF